VLFAREFCLVFSFVKRLAFHWSVFRMLLIPLAIYKKTFIVSCCPAFSRPIYHREAHTDVRRRKKKMAGGR